jgi:hypothetical protein
MPDAVTYFDFVFDSQPPFMAGFVDASAILRGP